MDGLPFDQAREVSDSATKAGVRPPGPRVLVVDDAPLNLFVAEGLLKALGVKVVTAKDGRDALDRLRADPAGFDLVLMDVQMPIMNGLEATRLIRTELGLSLPVFGLSAGVSAEEQDKCRQAGMDGFLGKPFQKDQLAATLANLTVGRPRP